MLIVDSTKNHKQLGLLGIKNYKILSIIIILFFFQSISILSAINVIEFFRVYKNITLGVLFFLTSMKIINNTKKASFILLILLGTFFLNSIIQIIIYWRPWFLYSILSNILYEGYWKGVVVQAERNRYFIRLVVR